MNGLPKRLSGKESSCQCGRHRFSPWVGKIPWRRKWQPTSEFLPGKSHGQGNLKGYSLWGHEEPDVTEHAGTQYLLGLDCNQQVLSPSTESSVLSSLRQPCEARTITGMRKRRPREGHTRAHTHTHRANTHTLCSNPDGLNLHLWKRTCFCLTFWSLPCCPPHLK